MKTGAYAKPFHAVWDLAKWGMCDFREELESDLKIRNDARNKKMKYE